MDRRGFLKRISAAAAAFTAAASGGGLALADRPRVAAKTLTPGICVTADTSKFEKSIGEAGRQVVELLRECRVVSVETFGRLGGTCEYTAIFKQVDGDDAPRTHLDDDAWQMIERGSLKAVTVSCVQDGDFDATDPDSWAIPVRSHYEIEATWIVPSS